MKRVSDLLIFLNLPQICSKLSKQLSGLPVSPISDELLNYPCNNAGNILWNAVAYQFQELPRLFWIGRKVVNFRGSNVSANRYLLSINVKNNKIFTFHDENSAVSQLDSFPFHTTLSERGDETFKE